MGRSRLAVSLGLSFGFWLREGEIIKEEAEDSPPPLLLLLATNPISTIAECLSAVAIINKYPSNPAYFLSYLVVLGSFTVTR